MSERFFFYVPHDRIGDFPKAQGCLMPMGVTSENVAAKFGVSRKTQDTFAVRSHKKAAAARAAGKFKDEIVPVSTKVRLCGGDCHMRLGYLCCVHAWVVCCTIMLPCHP